MIQNFEYYNPTRILFGKGQVAAIGKYIPKDKRILLVYGGGSIFKNGVYDQVSKALEGYEVHLFGGVEANPRYETLMQAVDQIRRDKLDYILAVGGGSVIDGVKFISAAVYYEGDPREILRKRQSIRDRAVPYASVLTLPATASEMNSGSVVTIAETQEKLPFGGPALFPQFSVCDPTFIRSLPQRQLENGVIDAFMHVLEQYLTYPVGGVLQDQLAEGILRTLLQVGPVVANDPNDYVAAANFMWACSLANNGLIQKGVPVDWSTHMIAHELTARYGIDHARTLAIVAPALYEALFDEKKAKLAQFARNVWGVQADSEVEAAQAGIEQMRHFFNLMHMENVLRDQHVDLSELAAWILARFQARGWQSLGEGGIVTMDKVQEIVLNLYN